MRVRYLEIERLRGKETQVIGDSDIQGEEIQRHRDSGEPQRYRDLRARLRYRDLGGASEIQSLGEDNSKI